MPDNFYREPQVLDARTRAALPDAKTFAQLPDGITHYELSGPPDGPPVALIHGLSTPMMLWDHVAPALAAAGFRVLRYDLFGRGYSDRPDTRYTLDLLDRQLLALLDALNLSEPVDLVGSSLGGALAVTFAARHPARVGKLALVAPARYTVRPPLTVILLYLPGIGDLIMRYAGDRVILGGLRRDFVSLPDEGYAAYEASYRRQLPYRGFKRALLSTLRSTSLKLAETYRQAGRQERPVLLLWGRQDGTIPLAAAAQIQADMPGAQLQIIERSGHIPHYEQPEAFNAALIPFLRGDSPPP